MPVRVDVEIVVEIDEAVVHGLREDHENGESEERADRNERASRAHIRAVLDSGPTVIGFQP